MYGNIFAYVLSAQKVCNFKNYHVFSCQYSKKIKCKVHKNHLFKDFLRSQELPRHKSLFIKSNYTLLAKALASAIRAAFAIGYGSIFFKSKHRKQAIS